MVLTVYDIWDLVVIGCLGSTAQEEAGRLSSGKMSHRSIIKVPCQHTIEECIILRSRKKKKKLR